MSLTNPLALPFVVIGIAWVSFALILLTRSSKKRSIDRKRTVPLEPWMFKETFPLYELGEGFLSAANRSSRIRIFFGDGLSHYARILPYFKDTHYFFLQIGCATTLWNFEHFRELLRITNPSFTPKNIVLLANEQEQREQALSVGFSSILCNHNCWLDEHLFTITNISEERAYDLVMNCRPERVKRPYLAGEIEKLAIIKGFLIRSQEEVDLETLKPRYINDRRLSAQEVCALYNQAVCGGIFSAAEGACYSSSEYLLCGLPVISTPSSGGRDVWYDESNSMICEVTPKSVLDCFHTIQQRLLSQEINREQIRRGHIQKSIYFRGKFVEALQEIFDQHQIAQDAGQLFQEFFTHKMKRWSNFEDSVKKLS